MGTCRIKEYIGGVKLEELKKNVQMAISMELVRANKVNNPLFNSMHEGFAVILEELQEAQEELVKADSKLKAMWIKIRENNTTGALECAQQLKNRTTLAACEVIQAAAMVTKFIESFE